MISTAFIQKGKSSSETGTGQRFFNIEYLLKKYQFLWELQFESFQFFFILLLKMIGLKPNHEHKIEDRKPWLLLSYVEVNGLTLDVD